MWRQLNICVSWTFALLPSLRAQPPLPQSVNPLFFITLRRCLQCLQVKWSRKRTEATIRTSQSHQRTSQQAAQQK